MSKTHVAFSTLSDPSRAAAELKQSFLGVEPSLVLFFASPALPHAELAKEMKKAFPSAAVVGCTTSGELAAGRVLDQSVVAMALPRALVGEPHVEVIREPASRSAIAQSFEAFERRVGAPMIALDYKQYVGLVLVDGLSGAEEALMEHIGDLTDVRFVGGSAGDDLKFQATYVSADGEAHRGAAVLVLLKPAVPFDIIKTQSFVATKHKLHATKVDEARRLVLEFDGRPAAQAYADALGVPVEQLSTKFMSNPLGLMAEGEPFVRSPQRVTDEGVVFYCNVKEGLDFWVLESTDIVGETKKALAKALGPAMPEALVNFNCILRTLELKQKDQATAYGRVFAELPMVGFSTYGEQLLGHINQTATMLVLR
ncbi:MAG: FIST N-terminal domain-containing protein [Polyangiaceae bacterium]